MQNNITSPHPEKQQVEEQLPSELIDQIIDRFNELDSGSDFFHSEIGAFLEYYLTKSDIDIKTLTKLQDRKSVV
jgi:hypothetical protein